ncbi:MAG: hypothetical protein VYD19_09280 [Myxococcota bacterium]|nr:hypothetical protein [Myxococcota bacterium]
MRSLLISSLLAPLPLLLTGCPNAEERWEEFNERRAPFVAAPTPEVDQRVVTDLAPGQDASPPPPDINGRFLFSLQPNVTTATLALRADVEATFDNAGQMTVERITLISLSCDNRDQDAEGSAPIDMLSPAQVVANGFNGDFGRAQVPGDGNCSTGTNIDADIRIRAEIVNEDLFCGAVDGQLYAPFESPLDGSTFGAVRLGDGVNPSEVELVNQCP